MRIIVMLMLTLVMGGCASLTPLDKDMSLTEGPTAKVTRSRYVEPAHCVAASATPAQRATAFGVIEFPDRTGRVNFNGNDAFGYFNTQGAADILATSFRKMGIRLVEHSPAFKNAIEWQQKQTAAKLVGDGRKHQLVDDKGSVQTVDFMPLMTGKLQPVRVAILGAITTTDFIPGDGATVGASAIEASYQQNRINVSIDMRAVTMPHGNSMGGDTIASTSIEKQIVQDGAELRLSRFFGPVTAATLVNVSIGGQRREAMQLSTRELLDLAAADIAAQVFRLPQCGAHTLAAPAAAG